MINVLDSIVLDTSVLIEHKDIIEKLIDKYNIILNIVTIEELDNLKTSKDESISKRAKRSSRSIENYKNRINFSVDRFIHDYLVGTSNVSNKYNANDDIIVSTAFLNKAFLATNDLNLKIKAKILGVQTIQFDQIESIYKGYIEYFFDTEEFNNFYENRKNYFNEYYCNEYIIIKDKETKSVIETYRYNGKDLVKLKLPDSRVIKGKNALQRCALDMLGNNDIDIVAILGLPGCVDCDTEYFNGVEWKRIADYIEGENVLQYNQETKRAELVKPLEYIKYPCKQLTYFHTKYGLDQCLSDEHQVAYITSKGNFQKKSFSEIRDLHENSKHGFTGKFITTFNYSGSGIELSDNEIELMCAVICDGSFQKSNTNRCRFHIKKDRKKEKLIEIFKNCKLKYSEYDSEKNGYTDFYVNTPRKEKEFSSYWYNCNQHQLQVICNNILFWDGNESYTKNGVLRKMFSTTSKKTADFIQFAFSACGMRATISINNRIGQSYLVSGKLYTRKSIEYNVIISNNNLVSMFKGIIDDNHKKVSLMPYKTLDGFKYCFTVPTSNLVLRRNNRIFVTGNSGKSYMALRMALQRLQLGKQGKILGVREPVGEGHQIGYLKGDFEDKTKLFFEPFVQCLDGGEYELQMRVDKGEFETQVPYFLKGTTYNHTIIVVDEAEDLSERQIRLIGTRLGEESRIFFSGDFGQAIFDSSTSNPLVKMCEELKGNPKFACIYLDEDVRSEASKIFADLYKK